MLLKHKRMLHFVGLYKQLTSPCHFTKVVGSIDQMEVDEPDNPDKNSAAPDSKSKSKRNLYVGTQALGYRWDHMKAVC